MGNIINVPSNFNADGDFQPSRNIILDKGKTSTFNGISYFNNSVTLSGVLNLSGTSSIQVNDKSTIGGLSNVQLNTLASIANNSASGNFSTAGKITASGGVFVGNNTAIDSFGNTWIPSGGFIYYNNGQSKVIDGEGNVYPTSIQINGNTLIDKQGNINLRGGLVSNNGGTLVDTSGSFNIQPGASLKTNDGPVIDQSGSHILRSGATIQTVQGNKIIDSDGNVYFAAGTSTIGGLSKSDITNIQSILSGSSSLSALSLNATTVNATTLSGNVVTANEFRRNNRIVLDSSGNLLDINSISLNNGLISGVSTLTSGTVNASGVTSSSYKLNNNVIIDASSNISNINTINASTISGSLLYGTQHDGSIYKQNGKIIVDANGNIIGSGIVSGVTLSGTTVNGSTVNSNVYQQGGQVIIDGSGNITSRGSVSGTILSAPNVQASTLLSAGTVDANAYKLAGQVVIDGSGNVTSPGAVSAVTVSGTNINGVTLSGSVYKSNGNIFLDASGNLNVVGKGSVQGQIASSTSNVASKLGYSVGSGSSFVNVIDSSANHIIPTNSKMMFQNGTTAIDSSNNFYLNGSGTLYGTGNMIVVDTSGNLNGSSVRVNNTQVIDGSGNYILAGNVRSNTGNKVIDSVGNYFASGTGQRIIDTSGNLYANGNRVVDASGNHYVPSSSTAVIDSVGNFNVLNLRQNNKTVLDASGNFYGTVVPVYTDTGVSTLSQTTSSTLTPGVTIGLGVTYSLVNTSITPAPGTGFYYYFTVSYTSIGLTTNNMFVSPVIYWSNSGSVTTFINMKNQNVLSGDSVKLNLFVSTSGAAFTAATAFTLTNVKLLQYFGTSSTYAQNVYAANINTSQVGIGNSANNWTIKENSVGSLCFYNATSGLNGTAPIACISPSGNLVSGTA